MAITNTFPDFLQQLKNAFRNQDNTVRIVDSYTPPQTSSIANEKKKINLNTKNNILQNYISAGRSDYSNIKIDSSKIKIPTSIDITKTNIPGLSETQSRMAQQTQSTQMNVPDRIIEYDSSKEDRYYLPKKSRILQKIGDASKTITFGIGTVLEYSGTQLGYASDIALNPVDTAVNEANKLTNPTLQGYAQQYFNEYNSSKTPLGFKGADDIILLGRIKALVAEQNKLNKRTGQNVIENISKTQQELNDAITEQNALVEGKIDVQIDPVTGKEINYYTGDDWDKVQALTNKIDKLENKLNREQRNLPTYRNLPVTSKFKKVTSRVLGLAGEKTAEIITASGTLLKTVSPYADITKVLSAKDYGIGLRTALTAPGLVMTGAISGAAEEFGQVDLGDFGQLDFRPISKGTAWESLGVQTVTPERNIVDKLLYEAGRSVPTEIKNVGLVFKPSAWEEQSENTASGLITTLLLAESAYKLVQRGSKTLIKAVEKESTSVVVPELVDGEIQMVKKKVTGDILGKVEGGAIGDDLVRVETQIGKKGVAKEVGDLIVQQEIDTLKNTISSKTFELIEKNGNIVRKLISQSPEKIISPVDKTLVTELKKQIQNTPNKIKIDDTKLINTLIEEQGLKGAINIRMRRLSNIEVGQIAESEILKTSSSFPSKIGKREVRAAGPAGEKLDFENAINSILNGEVGYSDVTSKSIEKELLGTLGKKTTVSVNEQPFLNILEEQTGRRLITVAQMKTYTGKEGQLYRKLLSSKKRTEQFLEIGDETSKTKKWIKPIYNEAGELIGVRKYIRPGPTITNTLTQTADINVGGLIQETEKSDIILSLTTKSGGPMKFKYNPLEVVSGKIIEVSKPGTFDKFLENIMKETGPINKKGALQTFDIREDTVVNKLLKSQLKTEQKSIAKFSLPKINVPELESSRLAIKNISKLKFDSRLKSDKLNLGKRSLALISELETKQKSKQKMKQTVLTKKSYAQESALTNMLDQMATTQVVRQKLRTATIQKTVPVQKTIDKLDINEMIGITVTTPVPEVPKIPEKIKIRIPIPEMKMKDFDIGKKVKKKKITSSRYSASLEGLLTGKKTKPKIITGIEMRGSSKNFSKQLRKLTGL